MKTCHHVGFTSDLDLDGRYEIYRPDYRIRHIEELEGIVLGTNGACLRAADGVPASRH
jgi:hypothetical protein